MTDNAPMTEDQQAAAADMEQGVSNGTDDRVEDGIPAFFATAAIPAVAKWAADKVKAHAPHDLECQGRVSVVRSWYFEGQFPRRAAEFYGQWDAPESGRQFTAAVRCMGGHYRGQKPTVLVAFTEYASKDGLPLPI